MGKGGYEFLSLVSVATTTISRIRITITSIMPRGCVTFSLAKEAMNPGQLHEAVGDRDVTPGFEVVPSTLARISSKGAGSLIEARET